MEVFIKVAPREYGRLRSKISSNSPAREAVDNATRIDHALEGILFEGYSIRCDEDQARIILDAAKQSCPDIIQDIEKAITFARSGT